MSNWKTLKVVELASSQVISNIRYVLDSMNRTSTKIKNIRGYIMTALYNAPDTVNSYYEAEVRHDMSNTEE